MSENQKAIETIFIPEAAIKTEIDYDPHQIVEQVEDVHGNFYNVYSDVVQPKEEPIDSNIDSQSNEEHIDNSDDSKSEDLNTHGAKNNGNVFINNKKHLSYTQKSKLVDFMENHPDLLSAVFKFNFTNKDAQRLWMNLADNLNTYHGAKKDWKHWRKAWRDIKSNVKTKSQLSETGDESLLKTEFSPLEKRVLALIRKKSTSGQPKRIKSAIPTKETKIVTPETVKNDACSEVSTQPKVEKTQLRKNTHKRLLHPSYKTVDSLDLQSKRANDIKEAYYKRKIKIMEEDLIVKSRIAVALENINKKIKFN